LIQIVALTFQFRKRRRDFLDNNYRFVAQHFQKKVGLIFALRLLHLLQKIAVFFVSHAQGYGFAACAILHCIFLSLSFRYGLDLWGLGLAPTRGH